MEMLEANNAANAESHYLHRQSDGIAYNNITEISEGVAAATNKTGIGLCLLPVHHEFVGCDRRALTAG